MRDFICKECSTELEYEQIQGMRLKHERKDGTLYFNVYCPKCKKYFEETVIELKE